MEIMTALLLNFAPYLTPLKIEQIKDDRAKIAVIDTGIKYERLNDPALCKDGHKDLTGTGLYDDHGHGTNIAGLIAKHINPERQCILVLKIFTTEEIKEVFFTRHETKLRWTIQAIVYAIQHDIKYINMSFEGTASSPTEQSIIELALKRDIRINVAIGNGGKDFDKLPCTSFPACYPFKNFSNWNVVSNRKDDGTYLKSSNRNGPETFGAKGVNQEAWGIVLSGTSQATANFTGLQVKREDQK